MLTTGVLSPEFLSRLVQYRGDSGMDKARGAAEDAIADRLPQWRETLEQILGKLDHGKDVVLTHISSDSHEGPNSML